MRKIHSLALYLDLLLDLGLPWGSDLSIYPWDEPSIVAKKTMASRFLKKFQDDVDVAVTSKAALDTFLEDNTLCGAWQLKCETFHDVVLLQYLKGYLQRFYIKGDGECILSDIYNVLDVASCGPGASVGSESTDFFTKLFDSRLSHTRAGLYDIYVAYIASKPRWREAEELRRSARGSASVVAGSRLSYVRKNDETDRTINIEPVLNMFYQLGQGTIIENRLRSFFSIDLSLQPDVNRALAVSGSLDDSFVTIDLKSASNSLALKMMEETHPRRVNDALDLTRSPCCEVPGHGSVKLEMVGTMGNGFTFPLQTALYSCIVAASFDACGVKRRDNVIVYDGSERKVREHGNWAVFGDDIIVPKEVTRSVLRLLDCLGFRVNSKKTFVEGPFRESCGTDAFKGVNVRGVSVKTLATLQDRYTAINLLNDWSARNGIPLPRTIRHIAVGLRLQPVPLWETEDCGIRVPRTAFRLLSSIKIRTDRNGTPIYWASRPNPKKIKILDDKFVLPRTEKPKNFNVQGLYCAFLAGYIANFTISLRPKVVRYATRKGKAPSWDFPLTTDGPSIGRFGGSAPERAVLINLMSAWR